jgi:hypothetical protein
MTDPSGRVADTRIVIDMNRRCYPEFVAAWSERAASECSSVSTVDIDERQPLPGSRIEVQQNGGGDNAHPQTAVFDSKTCWRRGESDLRG